MTHTAELVQSHFGLASIKFHEILEVNLLSLLTMFTSLKAPCPLFAMHLQSRVFDPHIHQK